MVQGILPIHHLLIINTHTPRKRKKILSFINPLFLLAGCLAKPTISKNHEKLQTNLLSPKRRGGDFGMEISNILNTSSTRFAGNFQRAERKLQRVLFLNLNPSSQTNFVILVLWTSRDQTSLDFLSRSQLVVDECGSSSFNNRNPANATPTSSCLFSKVGQRSRTELVDVIVYTSQYPLVPKSPDLPLYHKYSLLIIDHITHSHQNPKKLTKMMATTTTTPKILDSFIISLDLVLKMQTLNLQFPS